MRDQSEEKTEPVGVYDVPIGGASFSVRRLSMRDQRQVMRAHEIWLDAKESTDAAYAATLAAFETLIVGWENARDVTTGQPVPYTPGAVHEIQRVVDVVDGRALLLAAMRNGRPTATEKKT